LSCNERWLEMKLENTNKYYYEDGTTSSFETTFDALGDPRTLHREDGLAIEDIDGSNLWYLNGERHRKDGPAIEDVEGPRHWYLNGLRHREDGPAFEAADGTRHWWLDGIRLSTLTKKQLIKYMEANDITPAHLLTDSDEIIRTSAAKYDWKIV